MAEKQVIKAALVLKGLTLSSIALKSGTTRRNVRFHLAGTYYSPAVAKVIDELVGKEIEHISLLETESKETKEELSYE